MNDEEVPGVTFPLVEDIKLADQFRGTLLHKADAHVGNAPLWYGWVIMDAYLAGLAEGRRQKEGTS